MYTGYENGTFDERIEGVLFWHKFLVRGIGPGGPSFACHVEVIPGNEMQIQIFKQPRMQELDQRVWGREEGSMSVVGGTHLGSYKGQQRGQKFMGPRFLPFFDSEGRSLAFLQML